MDAFDAETYLRLLGEQLLLDSAPQHRRRSPLNLPASALVIAGVIDSARAEAVIDDHNAALGIRASGRGFPHFGPPAGPRPPGRLKPRQTMVLNHELAFADGLLYLRDLTIGGDAATSQDATLRFRWRADAPRSNRSSRMFGGGGHAFPWGTAAPVIADDQGNHPAVHSGGGGGNDSQWDGELQLHGPLSAATAWLEIEGTRIELDRRLAPWQTWLEPIPERSPIERFLWRRLAVAESPFAEPANLAPAIEALRAAGVLTGDEPMIGELEAVSARLPGRHGRPPTATPAQAGGTIPEPWRLLLLRLGRSDGPLWTRVLGAVSERFDGIQVAFRSIDSGASGFEAEFEVSPNVLTHCSLEEAPIAWWARDDRGNRHLGQASSWHGDDESASGTMRFWPPLDPRANELQLVVSAEHQQAVIAIPLTPLP